MSRPWQYQRGSNISADYYLFFRGDKVAHVYREDLAKFLCEQANAYYQTEEHLLPVEPDTIFQEAHKQTLQKLTSAQKAAEQALPDDKYLELVFFRDLTDEQRWIVFERFDYHGFLVADLGSQLISSVRDYMQRLFKVLLQQGHKPELYKLIWEMSGRTSNGL